MRPMTIGQVAQQLGITRDAIRLYEREGLIEKAQRQANGYRIYASTALARLHFIQRAKAMGFTLKEIGELLAISHTATKTCEEVRHQAEIKLAEVEQKILELQKLDRALKTLVITCGSRGHDHDCPLLDALEKAED